MKNLRSVAGPVREITRTITESDGCFSCRVDDAMRSYSSSEYSLERAESLIERQTDTLILSQLWDIVPGLQFYKGDWAKALKDFKEQPCQPK